MDDAARLEQGLEHQSVRQPSPTTRGKQAVVILTDMESKRGISFAEMLWVIVSRHFLIRQLSISFLKLILIQKWFMPDGNVNLGQGIHWLHWKPLKTWILPPEAKS